MDASYGKKVTINQVAEICGVSKTTISRFLNGKYENMSAETRARIAAAIEELRYRPDRSAQRLKASKTMLIGCVIGDISSPFSALLLSGINAVCEEAGYQVLFADSRESPKREQRAIEGFLENRVDGLIINTCGGNEEYLLSLEQRGIPTVLADRELMGGGRMDTVTSSNKETAANCTRFLLEQGYEAVAFFTEQMGNVSPRHLRCEGYTEAMSGRTPEIYEFPGGQTDGCTEKVRAFVDRHRGSRVAILAANGTSAQSVLLAANALGLELGYELGLCTFDDWNWFRIARPGITAVSQNSAVIGARAAELLLRRIGGSLKEDVPAARIEVPTELIVRDSTPAEKE